MSRLFLTKPWAPWVGGIILAACVAYGAALNNLFIPFDDNTLIYLNPSVQQFSLHNIGLMFTSYDPELYIPLTFLFYLFIHSLAGLDPGAYHAASLLLHLMNVVLVAWIIWQLTGKRPVTLIVTCLFALHPLHSEVVLWAAAMKDALSSTLGLLSMGLYLQWRSHNEKRTWILCVLFFALALLSKVSVVLLPLLFLLTDWLQGRPLDRKALLHKWPLYALSLIFVVIALAGKSKAIEGAGLMVNLLLPFKATAFYVSKLLWPTNLSILYPQSVEPSLAQPDILIGIGVVVLLLGIAAWAYKRSRIITAGILWYLLMLLPSFSTFQKGGYLYFASARYAYLPSIGLFLIVAVLVSLLWERLRLSRLPVAATGGILTIVCVVLVHRQVLVWHDAKALFGNVLRLHPDAVIAYNNYATELKDPEEALVYFKKAIELDPQFILAYRNIAGLYRKTGDSIAEKAVHEVAYGVLQQKNNPSQDDLSLLFEYAEFLETQGDRSGMFRVLEEALQKDPSFELAHYNLGVKYEKYGQFEKATPALEKALALNGGKPDTLYHLASVYAQTGKLQEAADLLERLVRINPGYEKAASHLANIKKLLGE